ncbi:hypothetical protein ATO7_07247 [Oceanococcus atlanticus]|uniref:Nucleotidyltransferase family protein n=1 Tax=Oceanococcus atlanticus TaxID=1317117 RepID=A0A1Y1SCU7_9GAMM|nr:hypothetical protein ATO7_07247 [Oceanococcus atlanticus]
MLPQRQTPPQTHLNVGVRTHVNQSANRTLESELVAIAGATPWLMQALTEAQKLNLNNWCIGAGAVRSVVWDKLHGFTQPTPISDIDLVYFDPQQADPAADQALAAKLPEVLSAATWEVVNQASVHTWYPQTSGKPVTPFTSLEEGIGSWPEYATAVGVTLNKDGSIGVVAPHGLQDLFGMVVRHNPTRATAEMYRARMKQKAFSQKWPKVTVCGEKSEF